MMQCAIIKGALCKNGSPVAFMLQTNWGQHINIRTIYSYSVNNDSYFCKILKL